MRVFISGQKQFGAGVFALCRQLGIEIVGVSTPAFGSDGTRLDRLREMAVDAGVPWMVAGSLNADTLPAGIDLIICAHSHDFIGQRTRLKSKLGAIGYHPSLLPLHRGRDAVRWSIAMGDRITGGSIYWLSDNVDAGPIAAQAWCFIRPGDTARELWQRDLAPIGVQLMKKSLTDLLGGIIVAVPQDPALATWEPSFDRAPLHRPDLLLLGHGGLQDYRVETDVQSARVPRV